MTAFMANDKITLYGGELERLSLPYKRQSDVNVVATTRLIGQFERDVTQLEVPKKRSWNSEVLTKQTVAGFSLFMGFQLGDSFDGLSLKIVLQAN